MFFCYQNRNLTEANRGRNLCSLRTLLLKSGSLACLISPQLLKTELKTEEGSVVQGELQPDRFAAQRLKRSLPAHLFCEQISRKRFGFGVAQRFQRLAAFVQEAEAHFTARGVGVDREAVAGNDKRFCQQSALAARGDEG